MFVTLGGCLVLFTSAASIAVMIAADFCARRRRETEREQEKESEREREKERESQREREIRKACTHCVDQAGKSDFTFGDSKRTSHLATITTPTSPCCQIWRPCLDHEMFCFVAEDLFRAKKSTENMEKRSFYRCLRGGR